MHAANSRTVHNVQCPSCAGVVECLGARQFATCLHCHARLFIEQNERCPRYVIETTLTADDVASTVTRTLAGGRVATDFLSTSPESVRLVYVPIYEVRGTSFVNVETTVTDRELRRRQSKQARPTHFGTADDEGRTKDTTVSLRDVSYLECALSAEGLGVEALDLDPLRRGELRHLVRPFSSTTLEGDYQIFSPDKTAEQVQSIFISRTGAKQVRRGVTSDLFGRSVSLTYYPLYIARYHFDDSYYRFVVDGATGTIVTGRAPENRLWCSFVAQSILLASAVVSFGAVAFMQSTLLFDQVGPLAWAMTIAISTVPLSLLYGVWLRLWFGRDIVVERGTVFQRPVFKREPSLLEGVVDTIEEVVHYMPTALRTAWAEREHSR